MYIAIPLDLQLHALPIDMSYNYITGMCVKFWFRMIVNKI